jgi:hypothetical protein
MALGSVGARRECTRIASGRPFASGVKFAAETTAGPDEEATEVAGKDVTGPLPSGHHGVTAHLGSAPELRLAHPGQLGGDPWVRHVRTVTVDGRLRKKYYDIVL